MSDLTLLGAGRGSAGGSAGPSFPATVVNDPAVGTVAWSDPANASASDDARAITGSLTFGVASNYLKATGFGFAIPGGATVLGIKATIEGQTSAGAVDWLARLVIGGSVVGSDYGAGLESGFTAGGDLFVDLGGAADLWGTLPTAADVNASNFGIVIQATGNAGRGSVTGLIDSIQLTVYYS